MTTCCAIEEFWNIAKQNKSIDQRRSSCARAKNGPDASRRLYAHLRLHIHHKRLANHHRCHRKRTFCQFARTGWRRDGAKRRAESRWFGAEQAAGLIARLR